MYKNININDIKNKTKDIKIIDVREEDEYKIGHLPNSINIPMMGLMMNASEFLKDKEEEIYINCQSGSRSLAVCQSLVDQGYKNIINLEGGFGDWKGKVEK